MNTDETRKFDSRPTEHEHPPSQSYGAQASMKLNYLEIEEEELR